VINGLDLAQAAWKKSSYSDSQGGCVTVANLGSHCAVRDSKNARVHFVVSRESWTEFISWVRQDEDAGS